MRPQICNRFGAFTILEVLVVVGIVGMLLAVITPISGSFMKRAKKAKCISHMRTIHAGLLAYTTDVGHWPQMEEGEFEFSEDDFFKFWVIATEPYGLSQDVWVCPSDRALERMNKLEKQKYFGSYVVTRFDDKAQTPFRWNQPWVMEGGSFHGKGAHMLLPDGSVQDTANPFYGR
tara:strand:- start:4921 stop:5445 length:525 start_codon:yes stop_codon:yes gene_type:complete